MKTSDVEDHLQSASNQMQRMNETTVYRAEEREQLDDEQLKENS